MKTRVDTEYIRLRNAEVQAEENKSAIRKLQDELKDTASSELVAVTKGKQSAEKVLALENELLQVKKAFTLSEETYGIFS